MRKRRNRYVDVKREMPRSGRGTAGSNDERPSVLGTHSSLEVGKVDHLLLRLLRGNLVKSLQTRMVISKIRSGFYANFQSGAAG